MSDCREFVYYAWLASAAIPPDDLRHVLETFGSPAECYDVFRSRKDDFRSMIPPRSFSMLEICAVPEKLNMFEELMRKHGIRAVMYSDPDYPESLDTISAPPAFLFYLGDLRCLSGRMVAMVGSRAASYAGQKATRKTARELSTHGVSIISGMACGIDAEAHWGCIEGGSPTVAVLGCGLDRIYPSDNLMLRNTILNRGGLMLSEYAPGEKPAGWHFPIRNRIITGLSAALILMEAKIRSGSMTSVQHALDQGKDVFAYPGDPDSPYFEGNHQLLREGAVYFTNAEDILEDLGWLDNQRIIRHNIDCSSEVRTASAEETAVLRALTPGVRSFEQLLEATGLSASALLSTLTLMQIRGQVESMPGKLYQLKS